MGAIIRLATVEDAGAVQAIYAPYVRDTTISFELEPPDVEAMCERITKTLARLPWLVSQSGDGTVMGYAYAGLHRERWAYQWSVDVSAYIDPRFHRMGLGRGLYLSLFALLRLQGYYNAFAGVTLPNEASVGLHTALGLQPVGVYRSVGYKFGAWHDVAWFGMPLHAHPAEVAPPRPLAEAIHDPGWPAALQSGLPAFRL